MKNLIIVGASRSGKSTVAKEIAKINNMTYIPLDAFVSTLENLYPEVGIKHLDDNLKMSIKIAVFLKELVSHLKYEDINYVIDLYQVYPKDLSDIIDPKQDLVVYFGYPNLVPKEKLEFVKKHAREKDWTRNTPDSEMIGILELFIAENKKMHRECIEIGYPFFDTGKEFNITIQNAIEYILKEL
ncbi:MAG: hypothetical protein KJ847_00030 [Firmicutes bacterium]|nr:hypothetical protein [Bacillota bacterium]